jgi:hypothetical protein
MFMGGDRIFIRGGGGWGQVFQKKEARKFVYEIMFKLKADSTVEYSE